MGRLRGRAVYARIFFAKSCTNAKQLYNINKKNAGKQLYLKARVVGEDNIFANPEKTVDWSGMG